MGKKRLVDLSHPFGGKALLWPYFNDVRIERMHYHAKQSVSSLVGRLVKEAIDAKGD